jgi:hypothetical protein
MSELVRGTVELKVPKLMKLPMETAIIEYGHRA